MQDPRIKLLMVVDFRGWAWDHKAHNLRRELLSFGIKTDIAYFYDYCCDSKTGWHDTGYVRGQKLDFSGYDAVLIFSLTLCPILNDTLDMQRAWIGICSHVAYNGRPENAQDVEILNRFRGVFVLNHLLFAEFRDVVEHLYFCPNGVDTKQFTPITPLGLKSHLVVGWVGDPDHACQKGFYEVIHPAMAMGQHRLVMAGKGDSYRTYDDMPNFYNSIDVYVCASQSEGTPNPCLEAAACGRPILTTAVGNMPEFVRPGHNGFFISRSPTSLAEHLDRLSKNRGELRLLGKNARHTALQWDWSNQTFFFLNMLRQAIPLDYLESVQA